MTFDMQALVFINSFKLQVFQLFLHFLINPLDFPFYRSSHAILRYCQKDFIKRGYIVHYAV